MLQKKGFNISQKINNNKKKYILKKNMKLKKKEFGSVFITEWFWSEISLRHFDNVPVYFGTLYRNVKDISDEYSENTSTNYLNIIMEELDKYIWRPPRQLGKKCAE